VAALDCVPSSPPQHHARAATRESRFERRPLRLPTTSRRPAWNSVHCMNRSRVAARGSKPRATRHKSTKGTMDDDRRPCSAPFVGLLGLARRFEPRARGRDRFISADHIPIHVKRPTSLPKCRANRGQRRPSQPR
jgi:hypothetical protein